MRAVRTPGISRREHVAGPEEGELRAAAAQEIAPPWSTACSDSEADADARLQASRRMDWRFLLPTPDLGRTALLGAPSRSLLESIRLFAESVTRFEGARQAQPREAFDLVVGGALSPTALALAHELLRPGGTLYLEAPRIFNPVRGWSRPPLRCAADYAAALKRLGFRDVQAHWHWPDLERTTVIVPLEDPTSLHHALGRELRGILAAVLPPILRTVGRPASMARLVPWFSMVALKPGGTGGK